MSIEFLVTSIVVILLPGTGVLYTLSVGLGQGIRPSIVAAFGCTLGIVPHILASIVGLAAVLHTSALAFQILKYLGVAYLFYMAWMIMREDGALQVSERRIKTPYARIILNGILLNVLNPKLTLFFLAFLPQFVPATIGNPTLAMLWLSAVFMLLTFLVFVRLWRVCGSGPQPDHFTAKSFAVVPPFLCGNIWRAGTETGVV